MNTLLSLYHWLTGHMPPATVAVHRETMSREREAYERSRSPQFYGGPLDGMTEREAARLPFTWGRDQGEIWMQYNGHRYYHTDRGWRWAGRVREAAR